MSEVELLAPAGTWDALEAAVEAGADAVYLGGKRFNMRLHRRDANFDDDGLARAVEYTRARGVRLYVTVNNLVSEAELPELRAYLAFLQELGPDALIVQDPCLLELARSEGLKLPLHASVMMNTHNEAAVRTLQEYGVTRVIFSRELSLAQLTLIRDRTGIELEYFVHGDMCVAHSGQCLHSGVVFGQSSNRGRCLKPCRWPYGFTAADAPLAADRDPGPYKLALKDMCLYLHLPQLIQAGVVSFKIEGRMRTADFVGRITGLYRRAIDRYLADPAGYAADQAELRELHAARARDFSTCYAFGNPGAAAVGFSGAREPRFFSQAVKEASTAAPAAGLPAVVAGGAAPARALLTVRVADKEALAAAYENGADVAYVGGEAFRPARPWTLADIAAGVATAEARGAALVVTTPRITTERECGELAVLLRLLEALKPHGVMVSNPGALRLAGELTTLPLYADFSFNLFNSLTARWLNRQGVSRATVSLEATGLQAAAMAAASPLPLEVVVHGPLEAMVMDYCLPRALLGNGTPAGLCRDVCQGGDFALTDSAGERHAVKIDQYCRNHILFGRDLCLAGRLAPLAAAGIGAFRIEGQHYSPGHVGEVVAAYRRELDGTAAPEGPAAGIGARRPLGVGVFRYEASR
ncbi:peptidase U32 family protein [Anaeroselena agilis]|uniref:U32 family peptidase n=1 Tax=Anaeroselena agilis TaxID=3063788 RepID=A0ABU3NWP3_9FIRM|nr:U32 family peptidase [Selenomonadales bacterium 4137-cl]